jgi:ABC transporter substrate binding protein
MRKWLLKSSPSSIVAKLAFQSMEWDLVGKIGEFVRSGTPLLTHLCHRRQFCRDAERCSDQNVVGCGSRPEEWLMRRREFITLLGGGAAAWPLGARAQQSRHPPVVGVLWHAGSAEDEAVYLNAVRQGLSDHGYVEGQNVTLENRFPAEIPERFVSLAAELAALNVNVLVAINRIAALAAQRATTTIPIVFVAVPDPVGSKLVASLAHPGGNITGLTNFAYDLTAKRFEYLAKNI